jgi:hypothetical protein
MLSSSGALGRVELALGINLALETVEERHTRILREPSRVALRMERMGGEPGSERALCARHRVALIHEARSRSKRSMSSRSQARTLPMR